MTDRVNQNNNGFEKKNIGRYYEQNNNYLQYGMGSYINEYGKKNNKINPSKFVNKSIYNKIKYESNDYNVTKRVLIPEKNLTKLKPTRKRFFSQERNFRHTTDGSYQSLLDRTPLTFKTKGRKKINRSIDYKDHDLFLRKNIENDNSIRLFGVERKNITKNHNLESEPPKFKFGRKHFYFKETSTSLY